MDAASLKELQKDVERVCKRQKTSCQQTTEGVQAIIDEVARARSALAAAPDADTAATLLLVPATLPPLPPSPSRLLSNPPLRPFSPAWSHLALPRPGFSALLASPTPGARGARPLLE